MDDYDLAIAEQYQERMCDLCERHILGCKSMTSTFMCEGSKCHVAVEYLKDELNEEKLTANEELMFILIK
jgi:hypothetical protein